MHKVFSSGFVKIPFSALTEIPTIETCLRELWAFVFVVLVWGLSVSLLISGVLATKYTVSKRRQLGEQCNVKNDVCRRKQAQPMEDRMQDCPLMQYVGVAHNERNLLTENRVRTAPACDQRVVAPTAVQ